jgi:uncharacterized protein with FMN-binding domain
MVMHPAKRLAALAFALPFLLSACAAPRQPAVETLDETVKVEPQLYGDGDYIGAYNDGGIEQFSVEFSLQDGIFTQVRLNSVNYKDGDYLNPDATRIQSQVSSQYQEAAAYLVGKPVSAVADLLQQDLVTSDRDTVTAATLRTGKLVSALRDGLIRGPFRTDDGANLHLPDDPSDGRYEGAFFSSAREQVRVSFLLINRVFADVYVQVKPFDGMKAPLGDALADTCETYLTGKTLQALSNLYTPADSGIELAAVGLENGALVSAFMDGLMRGVYEPVETTVFPTLSGYENGVYRGFYDQGGVETVSVQFEVINDVFGDVQFRSLQYEDRDYLSEDTTQRETDVGRQFKKMAEYLTGKEVSNLFNLFSPARIAQDADGCSAATLPTNKLISAIMDGLNRGVYRQVEMD